MATATEKVQPSPAAVTRAENLKDEKGNVIRQVGVKRAGNVLILPADPALSIPQIQVMLDQQYHSEERVIQNRYTFECWPFDGALAWREALREKYGWVNSVPTQTFFGERPPRVVTIATSAYGDTEQVFLDDFQLPGIEGKITATPGWSENRPQFNLVAQIKRKDMRIMDELAETVRANLRKSSIYRGKAVMLKWEKGTDEPQNPVFMDVKGIGVSSLIFPHHTMRSIETNLLMPVMRTQKCRDLHIPLKRGVLLNGKFGVGKTLTARVMASLCEENGWSFALLDNPRNLATAVGMMALHQPACIFVEDVDTMFREGERTDEVNDLLNTIDGIGSKKMEMMVVLTTNHPERMEPAMLRPGRLDAIVTIPAPDADAAERLIRMYARDSLKAKTDLTGVGGKLAGMIPAVIREVVERSKLFAVSRDDRWITTDDLDSAAEEMKSHMGLIDANMAKPKETPADLMARGMSAVVSAALTGQDVTEAADAAADIARATNTRVVELHSTVNDLNNTTAEVGGAVKHVKGTTDETLQRVKRIT